MVRDNYFLYKVGERGVGNEALAEPILLREVLEKSPHRSQGPEKHQNPLETLTLRKISVCPLMYLYPTQYEDHGSIQRPGTLQSS